MPSIDRVRTGWRARWRTPDGFSRSRTFARKADAERFLTGVEAAKLVGGYVDPSAGRIRFDDFAEQWLAAQTSDPSTVEAMGSRLRAHILPTFGYLELRSIRPSTVQSWLRGRQQECAPRYVRVMLANLSAILAAAVEDGLIQTNPCAARSVRAPAVEQRRVVPWTVDQLQAVVDNHPARWRAVPVLAAGCGLRQGEVFGLRVADVDVARRLVLVRQQVKLLHGRPLIAPPKGRKVRELPLPEVVALEIEEHLRRSPAVDGLVFTSRERTLVSRNYFNPHVWKPALRAAGVDPTRENGMHALRHFYASLQLEAGTSVRALAELPRPRRSGLHVAHLHPPAAAERGPRPPGGRPRAGAVSPDAARARRAPSPGKATALAPSPRVTFVSRGDARAVEARSGPVTSDVVVEHELMRALRPPAAMRRSAV